MKGPKASLHAAPPANVDGVLAVVAHAPPAHGEPLLECQIAIMPIAFSTGKSIILHCSFTYNYYKLTLQVTRNLLLHFFDKLQKCQKSGPKMSLN